VWDEIDCEWQEVPPEECVLHVRVNVMDHDETGVIPFSAAYYNTNTGVWMGQGINADTSFDGDIVVHELGHHVTRGFGYAELTGDPWDESRRFIDSGAINEASSDFLARQMFDNDRIYDYYSHVEPGNYNGERIRDVSIPFSCPANITGESHMDGRIWVTAMRDVQIALRDAGLGTEDEFASIYYAALPAIRQLPREQPDHLQPGAAIVVDEVAVVLGDEARDVAQEILDARGLLTCDRTLDIRDDPWLTGGFDPDDPLTARFMQLWSWRAEIELQERIDHPKAPPLLHRVTLGPDETRISLRYIPDFWRARAEIPRPEFSMALMVKRGATIAWIPDPQGGRPLNDADSMVIGEPVPGSTEGEHEIIVDGLEPGETYAFGLVNLTGWEGYSMVANRMRWSIGDDPGGGDGGAEDGGASGDGDGDAGESGGTGGADGSTWGSDGGPSGESPPPTAGCACATGPRTGSGADGAFALLLLAGFRHRRREGSADTSA
jgi:MYXO-CTERM domain-containing protein